MTETERDNNAEQSFVVPRGQTAIRSACCEESWRKSVQVYICQVSGRSDSWGHGCICSIYDGTIARFWNEVMDRYYIIGGIGIKVLRLGPFEVDVYCCAWSVVVLQ